MYINAKICLDIFVDDEPDYVEVKINNIGFLDIAELKDIIILKSKEGIEFPIVAFSGKVVQHIVLFQEGKKLQSPSFII